jgi:hypothetical protein
VDSFTWTDYVGSYYLVAVIVVEENAVKIWDLEEDFLVTRHQVSIHKPVLQATLLEEKKEIILLLEEGLVVTLNYKLEFTHKMSLGEAAISKFVRWSEDTLVFFAEDSRFYLYDWTKKRAVQDIYLREKVDMYCIENFGDLENRILDGEYKVAEAHISGMNILMKNDILWLPFSLKETKFSFMTSRKAEY